MSRKTLWMLAVVLAALAAALWWSHRGAPGSGPAAAAAGPALLPDVDLGSLRSVVVTDGAVTARLAKVAGVWSVADPDGYPADLDRLRELIRAIDGADAGQLADAGADRLSEYGLAPDDIPPPLRIELEHAAGTAVLRLGKMREPRRREELWGPPSGRFARVDEGPVRLLKDDLRLAQADPGLWWDRQLLEIPPASIRKVEVGLPEDSFAVERDAAGGYALAGAAEDETVDAAAAARLFGALRDLQADRILPPPGEGDDPFANATRYTAEWDGGTVVIQVGAAPPEAPGARSLKIEVSLAEAAAWTGKLEGRVFQVPAYLADSLTLKREDLVRPAPPPPSPEEKAAMTPAPETAGPPADSEAAE